VQHGSHSMSSIKIYNSGDFPTYLPKLNLLYDDLFKDGKGFRSKLVNRIGVKIGLESRVIDLLAQTVEFIHNSSLLHDDLIDHSVLRRGKPAAWSKYTPEYAVLAGDYLLARVMVNLSGHGNVRLIQRTAEAISDLLEGEWIQDSLIKDFSIKISDLNRVHDLKTGSLFKWCLSAPFIAKERYDEKLLGRLEECGTILGLLFQRSDDLLDFDIRNDEGKAVLGDLRSGYLNSFAVWVLRDVPAAAFNKAVLAQSLGEFKGIIGEIHFNHRAAEFDIENQKSIDLYFHRLEDLRECLASDELGVIEDLKTLPKPLYWRKRD
jgi:octaprenyl-diphosphate synthase